MSDHYVVTGCAGFIGSSLVDRLLAQGHQVTGIDNFSTGQKRFLDGALKEPAFRMIEGDVLDLPFLTKAFSGGDIVFHFAANADVRFGIEHPRKDLEQNTIGAVFNRAGYATMRTCKQGNSYADANKQFSVVHDATKTWTELAVENVEPGAI